MSGWIKLEKDLLTDPRLVAASMALDARFELNEGGACMFTNGGSPLAQSSNVTPLPSVTLVVGGLARLWMIADTHIGKDDILALNVEQIDKLIGIDGFCEILPNDWLEILDGNRVKLPNYHSHNGSTAKERSSNAERQTRYRNRHKTENVTERNGVTLPDLDKTKTRQDKKKEPRVVKSALARQSVAQAEPAGEVERIFGHWREVHRHPQARLDDKRRKVIRSALKNYNKEQLCEAISGYLNSPHHMGQNETGTVYDALELMLRDAEHIDAGLRFHAEPPRSDLSAQTRRIISATENWTPPEMRHAGG